MVVVHVPRWHAAPIAFASAHGLVDLRLPLPRLLPYAALCVPLPPQAEPGLFAAFLLSSCAHFAGDVGARRSALAHVAAVCALLSGRGVGVAWTLFTAFYVCVHARDVMRDWHAARPRHATAAAVAGALCAVAVGLQPGDVVLAPRAQLGVVCHALVAARARGRRSSRRGGVPPK